MRTVCGSEFQTNSAENIDVTLPRSKISRRLTFSFPILLKSTGALVAEGLLTKELVVCVSLTQSSRLSLRLTAAVRHSL